MKPMCLAPLGALLLAVMLTASLGPYQHAQANDLPPSFVLDPSWPKPLPSTVINAVAHPWVTGEVGGTCVDAHDNVYTFNRGWEVGVTVNGVLQGNLSGAIAAEDASASAIPSPPVVAYNSEGDVIAGWGNPSLVQTGPEYGFAAYMAQSAHGCFVDYQGFIWFAGSGDGIVQKYDPVAAQQAAANATYLLQIGTKGQCDTASPPATTANSYTSCNEDTDANTSHTLLNEPADIAIDPNPGPVSGKPGDVYIADGYGNHRIVVFNAQGQYVGQWGTTCTINGTPTNSESCPAGTFGATGGGHPHCVVLGNDGLVYVCDRPNDRIQVFNRTCAVASTPSNPQPVCQPVRIINISNFNSASSANQGAILLAGTRATDIDFWPNIDFLASKSPTSQNHIVNVDLGNDNVWVLDKFTGAVVGALGNCGIAPCPGHNAGNFSFGHMLASDSQGNVYVSETVTGRRNQKFVPVFNGSAPP
jgi:streptogramin lyase